MAKRNYFFSYQHLQDSKHLKTLREKFDNHTFSDYGFKEQDLAKASKYKISRKIQYRLWSTSITIVLVGEETGLSKWVDWEIWYSLRTIQIKNQSNRRFNPKGLIALYLPVNSHSVPARLEANLKSGYARKLLWKDLETDFDAVVEEVYRHRSQTHLIDNSLPRKIEPRLYFE